MVETAFRDADHPTVSTLPKPMEILFSGRAAERAETKNAVMLSYWEQHPLTSAQDVLAWAAHLHRGSKEISADSGQAGQSLLSVNNDTEGDSARDNAPLQATSSSENSTGKSQQAGEHGKPNRQHLYEPAELEHSITLQDTQMGHQGVRRAKRDSETEAESDQSFVIPQEFQQQYLW
jgi:hypothetical protein